VEARPGERTAADVVLFRPKYSDYRVTSLPVPWGLLSVASYLKREGLTVRIIDELALPDWAGPLEEALGRKPVFCGVSVMTGKQIKYGLRVSRFVKARSRTPVVWGGIHPSVLPGQTLADSSVDFVVKGEGEETAVELAAALAAGRSGAGIAGLGFKRNGRPVVNEDRPFLDLDALPETPFDLIDVERYVGTRFGARRSFELCTSRGCPHDCAFCYNPAFSRRRWRTMSVGRILDRLRRLIGEYRIDGLTWREDDFFVDRERVKAICEGLIREKFRIKWHADCRVDYLDGCGGDFLELLKESGCRALTLGVESGSDRILRKIGKGITREQVLRVRDRLSRAGIVQNYHFMMGFPGETDDDLRQTVGLMDLLMKDNPFFGHINGPSLYTPYPGTGLYEESLRRGFEPPSCLEDWTDMDWHALRIPWLTGRKRRIVEDTAWNIMGISQRGLRAYSLLKFRLLARRNIHIPCFERRLLPLAHRLRGAPYDR